MQVENPLADLLKDSHGLPTNKLLGSTDVERGSPEFLKRIFNHLLTFMSRKNIILYGLEQLRLGSGSFWLFGVAVLW